MARSRRKNFQKPFNFCKEMKPEVRRFVEAQKRKDTRTVEQMYIENLRKENRKKKVTVKNRLKPFKTV